MSVTSHNKTMFGKDVFLTGKYVEHFNPDEKRNPFSNIYKQKKRDTIDIVNGCETSKTILDVGGGMGRLSLSLVKSGQNKLVLADLSVDMLRLAVKNACGSNKIKVVQADAHHLPFRDTSFDYVLGLDLFCHLESPQRALNEFRRVLTKNGFLILDSTNSNPLWALFYPRYLGKNPLNWLRIMRFKGVYPGWQSIVKHYPKNTFLSLLAEAGFRVKRTLNYGPRVCPKWHLALSQKTV